VLAPTAQLADDLQRWLWWSGEPPRPSGSASGCSYHCGSSIVADLVFEYRMYLTVGFAVLVRW
jgi:hypothetical protein